MSKQEYCEEMSVRFGKFLVENYIPYKSKIWASISDKDIEYKTTKELWGEFISLYGEML